MVPGAGSKFGALMFEPELFRKQICSIEESTCAVGTFRRPGNCTPFSPLVTRLLPGTAHRKSGSSTPSVWSRGRMFAHQLYNPVATGGFFGLRPPNQASSPPKWNV